MVKARGKIAVMWTAIFLFGIPGLVFFASRAESAPRDIVVAQALDAFEAGPVINNSPAAPEVKVDPADYYFLVPENKEHSFNAGYEMYSYSYVETVDQDRFMDLKGDYTGYFIDYAYRPTLGSNDEYVPDEYRLEGRIATGDVDYDGSMKYAGLEDSMYELRGLIGKRFVLWKQIVSAPYLGIGFRNLLNKASEMPATGSGDDQTWSGYDRESRYMYFPIGADFRTSLRGGWGLDLNVEYDKLIWGEQESHFEDMQNVDGNNVGWDKMTNKQHGGYGIRSSLKIDKELTPRMSLFVEPFFRYWHIGDSDIQAITAGGLDVCDDDGCWGGREPENDTKEIGVKMGVGF